MGYLNNTWIIHNYLHLRILCSVYLSHTTILFITAIMTVILSITNILRTDTNSRSFAFKVVIVWALLLHTYTQYKHLVYYMWTSNVSIMKYVLAINHNTLLIVNFGELCTYKQFTKDIHLCMWNMWSLNLCTIPYSYIV